MRYLLLAELQSGMILGQPLQGKRGDLLLGQGQRLDEYFISRLKSCGFSGAYIEEPGFEEVQPVEVLDAALRADTNALMEECLDELNRFEFPPGDESESLEKTLIRHPELLPKIPVGKVRNQISQIIEDISYRFSAQLPCLLLKNQSQYQVQHGTDVALISILLGMKFNLIYRELRQVGTAALLHDVGKCVLADHAQKNIGSDHPRYQDHPYVGAQVILHSGEDLFTECAAVQQHHERQDGKGFPDGLRGENKSPGTGRGYHAGAIYRLAEILSVADAYDVLTSGAFGTSQAPEQSLQNLLQRNGTEFNRHVVGALVGVVQIFPVGSPVRIIQSSDAKLSNWRGVVCGFRSEAPHQCDLILSHDASGQRVTPSKRSLAGDAKARLTFQL